MRRKHAGAADEKLASVKAVVAVDAYLARPTHSAGDHSSQGLSSAQTPPPLSSLPARVCRGRQHLASARARVCHGVGGDSLLCSGLPESFVRRPGPRQPVPKARHVLSSGCPRAPVWTKAGLSPRRGGNQSGLAVSPGSIPGAAEELVRVVRARRSDEVGLKEPSIVLKAEARDRTVLSLFLAYISKGDGVWARGARERCETRRRAARMALSLASGPALSPFACKKLAEESRNARRCA